MGDDSDELSPDDWNYRNDEREEIDENVAIASIASFFFGITFSAILIFSGEPFFGLIILSLGIGLPLFFTEAGQNSLEDMKRQYSEGKWDTYNQQQQQPQQSRSKKICQTCGWQNPPEYNYCTDCGEELVIDE